ncbi:hypothetical protein N7931_15980 [Catenovulum sp. 2E275]|uniref:DUF6868 family protein n=1 Tax=Catenovulum sp. 2E275 TaxID=2980497 RepID=UPI0021D1CB49|nr:hypothetical protein [Catenovulum sp. 2E275]MCU4677134.1 hypothetical protein [Catenovulum sp. 2E275]
MDITQLTQLFMWMTIINIIILLVSTIASALLKSVIYQLHGKLFNLDEKQVSLVIYQYLAHFKVFMIVFNLTPYLALTIIYG